MSELIFELLCERVDLGFVLVRGVAVGVLCRLQCLEVDFKVGHGAGTALGSGGIGVGAFHVARRVAHELGDAVGLALAGAGGGRVANARRRQRRRARHIIDKSDIAPGCRVHFRQFAPGAANVAAPLIDEAEIGGAVRVFRDARLGLADLAFAIGDSEI